MQLTEDQKNLLVGFGVSVAAGLTAAGILSALAAVPQPEARNSVSIGATTGGTTNPVPGFYPYDVATIINVEATAFDGYVFTGWRLNGHLVSTNLGYQVQVEGQNILIASFEPEDGPTLFPEYVKPVQNCVATSWWRTWKEPEYGGAGIFLRDKLHLERDYYVDGFVKFKICDKAGNGVPGQTLCLYTDPMPDVTDYGTLFLDDTYHPSSAPVLIESDGDGIATAKARYRWSEYSDYKETIGRAGKVRYSAWWTWGDITPIYDLLQSQTYTYFESFTRLLHPIYRALNAVHAYWQDNPNLIVYGDAVVDCNVKIEDSKNYP